MADVPTRFSGMRLPARGETIVRDSGGGGTGEPCATVFVGTKVVLGAKDHEWNLVAATEVYADEGDHCAAYLKADRYGGANVWGLCAEVQDTTGTGAVWGVEVDVMTQPDAGKGDRYGIGVVVGRNPHAPRTAPAFVDFGLRLLPWQFDHAAAELGVGVDVDLHCRHAAVAIRAGDCIALDGPRGEVKLRFDAATGFAQLLFRGLPSFELQVQTGEVRRFGETILPGKR